ncbi:MAG: VWA domain-containing protein, partial [Verrucomicrobiae bacterium]|nr:VWA domain-containing protein [Verrucomicrobiae bacterium]
SSLMFLRPSPPRLSERSRLENLLLLLLRGLVVLLLALGFARPFLARSPEQPAYAAPARRVVLLIDQSASMQRGNLGSAARDRAHAVLSELSPADQAAVLLFARDVRPLVSFTDWSAAPTGDRVGLAASRLAGTGPGWGSTHLDLALMRAADLLTDEESLTTRREVVLISDLQEGSRLEGLQAYAWPEG